MDTELLVDIRIDDGRRLIRELVRDGFDVAVAFWVKAREEGLRFLYIASPHVETEKIGDAYRQVYSCLSRIPDAGINLSEIKLVNLANPIARDAIAVRQRYPGPLPMRYQGERLGSLAIEEAYIYPLPTGAMSRQEVLQTVAALIDRSDPVPPSLVTLHDGSTLQVIPTGIDRKSSGEIDLVFHDIATGNDLTVSADNVANIQ